MRRDNAAGVLRMLTGPAVVIVIVTFGIMMSSAAGDELNAAGINTGPSAEHWLGTDQLGRDVLARTIAAAPLSMVLAIMATLISVVVGTLVGIGLVLMPGKIRAVGLRVLDALLAFPAILVAVVICTVLDPGALSAVVSIGIAGAPGIARLTSNVAASQLQLDYVLNARVVGVGEMRLFRRYLLPPVLRSLGITATYDVGLNLVAMASLSFLGLGVQLPQYDWGRLLGDGIRQVNLNLWAAVAPAVAISLVGIIFAGLGERLSRFGSRSSSAPRHTGANTRQIVNRVAGAPEAVNTPAANPHGRRPEPVASVRQLKVSYPTPGSNERHIVVNDVSLTVHRGEIVGIIGESGSGKTTVALALADLLPHAASLSAEELTVVGANLYQDNRAAVDHAFRGNVSMVFQEPMTSLNPAMSVGRQLTETLRRTKSATRRAARQRALEALHAVRITTPALRLRQRPFELSGGMRQRVMVAMGVMTPPQLLIADEPTTALDVTVQRQLLDILRSIRDRHDTAILFISHNLGVVASICDTVLVMQDGVIVERGTTEKILTSPQHSYTKELLAAAPDLADAPMMRSARATKGSSHAKS